MTTPEINHVYIISIVLYHTIVCLEYCCVHYITSTDLDLHVRATLYNKLPYKYTCIMCGAARGSPLVA